MGNRAVITTPERKVGIYLHWNGGRDTIEPLLKYCELQGYRPPSSDEYGLARICQVMGNFLLPPMYFPPFTPMIHNRSRQPAPAGYANVFPPLSAPPPNLSRNARASRARALSEPG